MKRLFFSGAAAALILTACATQAEAPALDSAPAEPALAVDVYEGDFVRIQQFVTPGGVSVWLVTEPSIPILSVQMAWRGGSSADPDGLRGLGQASLVDIAQCQMAATLGQLHGQRAAHARCRTGDGGHFVAEVFHRSLGVQLVRMDG